MQGERLYGQHCANCHQADGTGLGKLYPPLAGSDYLRNKPEEVICLIRNGIAGPIEVNRVIYDQPMPGNATLTDLEIAEVVTYIRGEWAGDKDMTEVTAVTSVLSSCK
ncbi:MAG: c-type cytochrome [Bacteroidota bacterium]